MRVSGTIQDSIVDGKGLRFVLFTQGCLRACPGCHNPQTHDPNGGHEKSVDEILAAMLKNPLTDGITLSGGEPFLQAADCAEIARRTHAAGLNVWCYSGYTFEELFRLAGSDKNIHDLLYELDVLVDGAFLLAKKSLTMKFRGSTNQRILDVKKSIAFGEAVKLMD